MVNLPQMKVIRYELKNSFIDQNINNMRVENRHKRATYQRNFDIERSWIPNNNDITESMLSYSRRMSEVNQKRGFLTKEEERMELPLLIKATHLSHPNYSRPRSNKKAKRKSNHYATKARSLPNMKLEPLLGPTAKKYQTNTASLVDLKSIKGVKLKFLKSKNLEPIVSSHSILDPTNSLIIKEVADTNRLEHSSECSKKDNPNKMLSDPEVASTMEQSHMQETINSNKKPETENSQPAFKSLHRVSRKKKKSRILIEKSYLESIDEEERESVISPVPRVKLSLPNIYNPDARVENYFDIQRSIEDRRKDVALLRRINNSITSSKSSSQISMMSLAKRKFRKLPPMLANIKADHIN